MTIVDHLLLHILVHILLYPPPLYHLPSSTCGNGCGKYCLDLTASVLEWNESPPLERDKSTRGVESVLGRDSGTAGVGVTPDAALTEKREDINILLAIENSEYR